MDKSTFISRLIDVLHVISPAGRERIYQDICSKDSNVRLELVDIRYIENQICENYTNTHYIDLGINWSRYSDESTPVFRSKVHHLFRSKVPHFFSLCFPLS